MGSHVWISPYTELHAPLRMSSRWAPALNDCITNRRSKPPEPAERSMLQTSLYSDSVRGYVRSKTKFSDTPPASRCIVGFGIRIGSCCGAERARKCFS